MRRLIATLTVLTVVIVAVALVLGQQGGSSTYRVTAVFDDARGLVGGQLVKVAGARVGVIENVSLTPDYRARVLMSVDRRFAPFRANAACTIRPEGLIAENYVECDPGTADRPPLASDGGPTPTVTVGHNTEPVSLTDLFNIFDTPTRDRFSVIINELGIATAGRGDDINAIIRRANPALGLARRAITIVDRQRTQLAGIIQASDRLVGRLAQRSGRTQEFLVRAASVSDTIARHRDALSQTVARLPGLLREGRGALRSLDTVTATGTPLLRALHAAAPDVNRVSSDLPALARAAPGATKRLGAALAQGTATARRLAPLVSTLRTYSQASLPAALLSGRLYTNLRERGFVENLLALFYYGAAASARFDSVSHVLPAHVLLGNCLNYATTPSPGCSANYATAGARSAAIVATKRPPGPTGRLAHVLDYLLGR